MRSSLAHKRILAVCLSFLAALALFGGSAEAADDGACLICHSARTLHKTSGGRQVSLYVDPRILAQSPHRGLSCVDCHADLRGAAMPHGPELAAAQCAACHSATDRQLVMQYLGSAHGRASRNGDGDAARCQDCHGGHDVRPASDPQSLVSRANIASTCGKCHLDTDITRRHKLPNPSLIRMYRNSIHGRFRPSSGVLSAAACTDCHGSHGILPAKDPLSMVNRLNVPATCGECHSKIREEYTESIHGKALAEGVKDAPACTDCHGEHSIQPPSDVRSSVSPAHVSATCSKCHESTRIQRRYGLPANRLNTYIDSYHGIASKYGDVTVANCATCHGAHDIKPSSDPTSAISKKNLPQTCGKCHPNASANFAKGTIHIYPTRQSDPIVYWVRMAYRVFISLIVLAFIGYIVLDLFTHIRHVRGGKGW